MPDALDRAVDARIDAHRPDTVPPFAAIEARKRGRDRCRGAAAIAAVAVAVAGVAFVPSALTGSTSAPNRTAAMPTASPPAPYLGLASGGPAFRTTDAPEQVAQSGRVTDLTLRFTRDPGTRLDKAVLWVLKPGALQPTGPDATSPDVLRTLTLPAQTDDVDELTFAFDALDDQGQPLPAGSYGLGYALAGKLPDGRTANASGPYASLRVTSRAEAGAGSLRLTTDGVTGARLCLADAGGEFPDTGCRIIGKDGADRLARALDGAQPQGRQPRCDATGPTYRLTFDMPSARVIPILIPTACGPIAVGAGDYRINDRVVRAVGAEYGRETGHAEFIDRCVGADRDQATPAPDYLGTSEKDIDKAISDDGPVTIRILGRDGECIGRDSDLRRDRVNVVIADAKVVWAGRF